MKSICQCYMLERLGDMAIQMSASWAGAGAGAIASEASVGGVWVVV